jgi:hypothetical protein
MTAFPILLRRIALESADEIREIEFGLPNAGKKVKMIRH